MKRLLAIILSLCMVLALYAPVSFAMSDTSTSSDIVDTQEEATSATTSGLNVGLVIDGSTSLTRKAHGNDPTDINGYRYEAINSLIDLLPSNYYVDAVVFCGNDIETDSSDEAMETGIRLNTGLQSIESITDRDKLKRSITNAGVGNNTDIGTALLAVAEELQAKKAQNGLDCAIFLFTDGVTQLDGEDVMARSMENKERAIDIIREEDMDTMGLFLNDNGKLESTEVMDLVRQANGYSDTLTETELRTSKRYLPITSDEDLLTANTYFLDVLGLTPISFENEVDVRVPGCGISDINIMIQAPLEVLQNSTVTITRPDTSILSSSELNSILSRGATYEVFKITRPESGIWHISVQSPDDVELQCSLLLNTDFSASIECDEPSVHAGQDVILTAYLNDDSGKLTDKDKYNEFDCQLRIVNAQTGESELLDMELQDYGGFSTLYSINQYGTFYVDAVFSCGEYLSMHSRNMLTWIIENEAPSALDTVEVTIPYGLFKSGKEKVSFSDLVSDREDSVGNLSCQVSLDGYSPDAISKAENGILVDGKLGGSGEITLTFTDTQGASDSTRLIVTTKDKTSVNLTSIILAVVMLVLAIFGIRKFRFDKLWLKGEMEISLPFTKTEDNTKSISISIPASWLKGKNLFEVLHSKSADQETIANELLLATKKEFRVDNKEALNIIENSLATLKTDLEKIRFTVVKADSKANVPAYCKVIFKGKEGKTETYTFTNQTESLRITVRGNEFVTLAYRFPSEEDDPI